LIDFCPTAEFLDGGAMGLPVTTHPILKRPCGNAGGPGQRLDRPPMVNDPLYPCRKSWWAGVWSAHVLIVSIIVQRIKCITMWKPPTLF